MDPNNDIQRQLFESNAALAGSKQAEPQMHPCLMFRDSCGFIIASSEHWVEHTEVKNWSEVPTCAVSHRFLDSSRFFRQKFGCLSSTRQEPAFDSGAKFGLPFGELFPVPGQEWSFLFGFPRSIQTTAWAVWHCYMWHNPWPGVSWHRYSKVVHLYPWSEVIAAACVACDPGILFLHPRFGLQSHTDFSS